MCTLPPWWQTMSSRHLKDRRCDPSGYTLVEVMVTVTILALVLGLIASFFMNHLRLQQRETALADLRIEGLKVSHQLEKYLQSAGLDPAGTGEFGLTKATSPQLEFSADVNLNGLVETDDFFGIRWVNDTLYTYNPKNPGETQRVLSPHVDFFLFRYYKAGGQLIGSGQGELTPAQRDSVEGVQFIAYLITPYPLKGYVSEGTYPNGVGFHDHYGRYKIDNLVFLRNRHY